MAEESAARNTPDRIVYSNSSFRVLGLGWIAVIVVCGVALVTAPGIPWWGVLSIGPIMAALSLLGWSLFGAPKLVIEGQRLFVRNPFSIHEAAIGAVKEIGSGQHLVLRLVDGRTIRVWCIQATNLSLMLARPSHVDRVAAELRTRLTQAEDTRPFGVVVSNRRASLQLQGFLVAASALMALLVRLVVG